MANKKREAVKTLTASQWDAVEAGIRRRLGGDTEIEMLDEIGARGILNASGGRWSRVEAEHVDPPGGWSGELIQEVIKLFDLRRRQRKMLM